MMKTALALLLFGFTYALTSPSCSQEDFAKCSKKEQEEREDFVSPETEESLDELCSYAWKVVDCQMDLIERCPNSSKKDTEETTRVFSILCDKSNPLRKKFLDNSRCLNEFKTEVRNECNIEEKIDYMADEKGCMKLERLLKCAEKYVSERCGEDAKEALMGILDPDHQLRIHKCV